MAPLSMPTPELDLNLTPSPLSQSSFYPFGSVSENPRPDITPQSLRTLPPANFSSLHVAHSPILANQGSAIRYAHVASPRDLYSQAPSRRPSAPICSLFVCAVRNLEPSTAPAPASPPDSRAPAGSGLFVVSILERHPFTTQTFIPLGSAGRRSRYLVIVAPSLPPSGRDALFAVPTDSSSNSDSAAAPAPLSAMDGNPPPLLLPGRGLPDLHRMRAFIAHAGQAVTYGPGTWHAPMVALGSGGSDEKADGGVMEFVVTQFANGIPQEDCQEVAFEGGRIAVAVPPREATKGQWRL